MNYLLDRSTVFKNKERPKRHGRVIAILSVILFLYFAGPWLFRSLSGVVVWATRPLFEASEKSEGILYRTGSFFRFQKNLVFENEALKKSNTALREQITANSLLVAELRDLERIVGRYASATPPIVARVFDRPPHLPFDTLLVDIGRKDSSTLTLGDKVLVHNSILLGEIVQIYDDTAKVKLYSSPGTLIGVSIGPNNVATNAEGAGGGNFVVKLPRGVKIAEDDQVVVQKPRPYLLGTVGKVDNDPRNPLQTIYISIPINLYELSWVEIIND